MQTCLEQSALAAKDIMRVKYMPRDVINAGKVAKRHSKIGGDGALETIKTMSYSVAKKGVKPYLPGILAGAGFVTPAPFASVAGFCVGKFLQKLI